MSLKDIRERFEASTKGEWVVGSTGGVDGWSGHYGVKVKADEGSYDYRITPYHTDWEGYGDGMSPLDAEFTAAAHQDVPAMLDVLEEILTLHAPETKYELDLASFSWVKDENGEQVVEAVLCSECSGSDDSVSWPCATVQAIQKLDAR